MEQDIFRIFIKIIEIISNNNYKNKINKLIIN